jgi:hypothetical protein
MRLIVKKIISVLSGAIESYPILYIFSSNAFLNWLVLTVNFIFFYYVLDKVFDRMEKRENGN